MEHVVVLEGGRPWGVRLQTDNSSESQQHQQHHVVVKVTHHHHHHHHHHYHSYSLLSHVLLRLSSSVFAYQYESTFVMSKV